MGDWQIHYVFLKAQSWITFLIELSVYNNISKHDLDCVSLCVHKVFEIAYTCNCLTFGGWGNSTKITIIFKYLPTQTEVLQGSHSWSIGFFSRSCYWRNAKITDIAPRMLFLRLFCHNHVSFSWLSYILKLTLCSQGHTK